METHVLAGLILIALYIYPMMRLWEVLPAQRRALDGSLQKFQLTTKAITLLSVHSLLEAGFVINCAMAGLYLFGGLWAAALFVDLIILRRLFRDNNWFNDQLNKLKDAVKEVKKNLRSALTLPPLAPSPA